MRSGQIALSVGPAMEDGIPVKQCYPPLSLFLRSYQGERARQVRPRMSSTPHVPSFKSFVISPAVQREIDAQRGKPPQFISVIICPQDSRDQPEWASRPQRKR